MASGRKVIITSAVTGSVHTPTLSPDLRGLDKVGW